MYCQVDENDAGTGTGNGATGDDEGEDDWVMREVRLFVSSEECECDYIPGCVGEENI